ncbi:MAG TPA: hypothetical protein VFN49_12670, partial [Candidatus Aquilonibacter sp.]|nr:hypothetical protein [Candidatus Aquilonibacter sp.]
MKLIARAVLIAITACVLLIFYLPLGNDDYTGRWSGGTFGIEGRNSTSLITHVEAGSPAYAAGIRDGDRVAVGAASAGETMEIDFPRAGDRRTFTLVHPDGRQFSVTMTAIPVDHFTAWDRITGFLAIIPATVFLAVAFALVFLRPTVMTWSFYGVAVGYFSTGPSFQYFHSLLSASLFAALSFLLMTVFGNFSVMPLLPFVLRFPDDRPTGFSRTFERFVWVAIVCAFAAYAYNWQQIWTTGRSAEFVAVLDVWLPLLTFALSTYILIGKFKHASAQVRQRFGFLAIGLVVAFLAYAVYFVPGVPFAVKQIVGYAVIAMPVTVAYAVLRHRVIDVNFVLNRAFTYGILSVFVIAVVSVLDWTFSRALSEYHLAVVAELGATIVIGFLLDRINKIIESGVERVFFRHRREAERYLRNAADALPYAIEESAVSEGLVEVPAEALALSAAALYRKTESGRFEGVATSLHTPVAPPGFSANHLLVRMLQAGEER